MIASRFEAVIIGAGPAGCAAAIACRQQGLGALIITGKHVLRNQSQASESVHPGVVPVLAGLDAFGCIAAASRGNYEGIIVDGRYTPLGEDEHGPWQGHHIDRSRFDETLLQVAIKHGAEVLPDDPVTGILTDDERVTGLETAAGKRLRCRYVIDCSGAKRVAGKKLRFRESFYSPPMVAWTGLSEGIPGEPGLLESNAASFIPSPGGWSWLAPEAAGRCSWTRLSLKGRQEFMPPPELESYPLAGTVTTSNRRWRAFRPVCAEGVLLCGDSAGILDPAAGQGILNALVSGMIAGKTVKSCLANPALEGMHLARYDGWFMGYYEDKVRQLREFYKEQGLLF